MIHLRPMDHAIAGERAFVAHSWLESFGSSSVAELLSRGGFIPQGARAPSDWRVGPAYWRTWNPLVNRLLDRARTVIADDQGLIAGFLCWEPWEDSTAVHYLYTRLSYRGQGVARVLLKELPAGQTIFTHRSRHVRRVPETWRFSMAPLVGVHERKEAA